MPVLPYLERHDFTGKIIIPFSSTAGTVRGGSTRLMLPEKRACDPHKAWLSPECPADVQIQPANSAEQSQHQADDA